MASNSGDSVIVGGTAFPRSNMKFSKVIGSSGVLLAEGVVYGV